MSFFDTLRRTPAPTVAVEIARHSVAAASLEVRGGSPVIAAHASEPLPGGALVPSLTGQNVHDQAAVVAALDRVLERLGGRPRRVGLVVPDVVAKVSIVRFEKVPQRAQDLDELVRWQIRKTAPFAVEDAQVGYAPGLLAPDGQDFVVSLARRAVVAEYEQICAAVGAHAGIVDLATFNVVNAVIAAGDPSTGSRLARAESRADWLLVHMAPDYGSLAIVRDDALIFFRNRAADSDGSLADLVHQTAMYYEDRLQGSGFSRVVLAGAGRDAADADAVRRSLEERLQTPVDTVDPRAAAALTDRISAAPALLDTLAPLVGMLLRDRGTVKA